MFISEGFKFQRENDDGEGGIHPKLDYSVDNDIMDLDQYLADVDKANRIHIIPQRKDSETGFFESEGKFQSRGQSKVEA